MIQIRCDIEAFKAVYTNLEKEQIPFAASLALNNTVKGAQVFAVQGMQQNFYIRTDWVTREAAKITHFSNKHEDPMYARIQVSDKADFMNKFEKGGTKTSRSGRNVAVPILARPSKAGLVPLNLRPKNLHLRSVGNALRGLQRTFMMTTAGGKRGIFQRTGSGKRDYILLYWLVPSVPIPASLHFEARVAEAVGRLWRREFEAAFEYAMDTPR